MRAHQLWGCVLGNTEPLPVARACLRFDQSFKAFIRSSAFTLESIQTRTKRRYRGDARQLTGEQRVYQLTGVQ